MLKFHIDVIWAAKDWQRDTPTGRLYDTGPKLEEALNRLRERESEEREWVSPSPSKPQSGPPTA